MAQVADAYLSLLSDESLLDLTQQTLESYQNSYTLNQLMFDHGRATELDLRQSEGELKSSKANLAMYTRQVAWDLNALQLLVGAALPDHLGKGASLQGPTLLEDLPPNLPSEVLTQRPDILSAEDTLRSSNANIGAARAAFFPSITLTSSAGKLSAKLSDLFAGGSSSWSFAPQISVPIFDGGSNRANLDLAKVQKSIDVADYEKAIQTAFREVADALAARGTMNEQLEAQQGVVAATSRSTDLSRLLFKTGTKDYLSVLDSERSLYSAQQTLISVELDRLENLVSLYKAIGGGWSSG